MAQELDFRVIRINDKDDYEEISPTILVSQPWISEQDCEYPQEIVLELRRESNVERLHLLAHNSFVAQKIEIFTNKKSILANSKPSDFKPLGEVLLKEKKSSATKHELKTVFLDETITRIMLRIHENYVNRVANVYNQVGLIQLRLFGMNVPDSMETESFKYEDERENVTSRNGIKSSSELIDNKYTMELMELEKLVDRNKQRCVLEENFKLAKSAQLAQRLLRKSKKEMEELERDKNEAIEDEDFQRAQDLKEEMKTLRANVLSSIDPKLLEDVPNDPEHPDDIVIHRPKSIFDGEHTGPIPPPRLFHPVDLSPTHISDVGEVDYVLTPREERELLSIRSPFREDTPQPKGDKMPDRPLRTPSRSVGSSPKPPTPKQVPVRRSPVPGPSRGSKRPDSRDSRNSQTVVPKKSPIVREDMEHNDYPVNRRATSKPRPVTRPATRESYMPSTKPPTRNNRSATNKFYEKENMVVPAALKNRRMSDSDIPMYPSPEGVDENEFLDAIHPTDRVIASRAIAHFGLGTVHKVYSKNYEQRREGIAEIKKKLERISGKSTADDAFEAVLPILTRTLKDTLHTVYSSALDLLKYVATKFMPNSKLLKSGANKLASATTEPLVARVGDNAKDQRFSHQTQTTFNEIISSDKQISKAYLSRLLSPLDGQKSDRGRASTVIESAQQLGNPNREMGLSEKAVGKFAVSCMKHTDPEIRNIGKQLFLDSYSNGDKNVLKKCLPDEKSMHRNQLFRQLYSEMQRMEDKTTTKKELTVPSSTPNRKSSSHSIRAYKRNNRSAKSVRINVDEDTVDGMYDKMCMFCGVIDESFTSENLDNHYLKKCPMLKKCEDCNEVLEICSLKDHLLTECEGGEKYEECMRCKEPIDKKDYQKHIRRRDCKIGSPHSNTGRCLLCHLDVQPNNDVGWRKHLMGKCRENMRKHGILKRRNSVPRTNQ